MHGAKGLAHVAANAIANHGVAHPLGHRYANARMCGYVARGNGERAHVARVVLSALVANSDKFTPAANAVT